MELPIRAIPAVSWQLRSLVTGVVLCLLSITAPSCTAFSLQGRFPFPTSNPVITSNTFTAKTTCWNSGSMTFPKKRRVFALSDLQASESRLSGTRSVLHQLPFGTRSVNPRTVLRAEASDEDSSDPAADTQVMARTEEEAAENDDPMRSGQPGAVDVLRDEVEETRTVTPERLAKCFSFPLDEFQMGALTALVEKRSVVVSAPTGSGKTVCGEAAVYLGMALKKRVMYTTPLKALSNQKYNDFCKQFGAERVGLLTGDISLNRENASVLVLTTEVYRNMLYDKEERSVRDVHSVILDEFHYMNDRDRGTVWEESVIHTPKETLIVALSATMRNVNDIRDWFTHVHGPTDLVTSDFRPVPLLFKYADRKGIMNLFDKLPNKKGGPRLNRGLLPGMNGDENARERRSYESGRRSRGGRGGRSGDREKEGSQSRGGGRDGGRGGRGGGLQEVPSFGFVVRQLKKREMLPTIVFIFSRLQCDRAAEEAASQRGSLVTEEEKARLREKLGQFVAKHREVAQEDRLRLALKGIASHHAGLVPLWKSLVEELFQENLIKVVFATETLAAGINMPARSTVITALSKRTDQGITSLTSNELRQMCGRAGRRGKDTVGHAVIMRSRWEGAPEGFTIVTQPADPLTSKFSPTYSMVLNLLLRRPLDECRQIVENSFGGFLAMRKKKSDEVAAEGEEDELAEALRVAEGVDREELRNLLKLTERLKSEQRLLQFLAAQAEATARSIFEDTLPYCAPGTPLRLKAIEGSENPEDQDAILLDLAPDAKETLQPFFVCLTKSNLLRRVTHNEVEELDLEAEPASFAGLSDALGNAVSPQSLLAALPPRNQWLRSGREKGDAAPLHVAGGEASAALAGRVAHVPPPPTPPEVMAQQDRLDFVEGALRAHPLFSRPDRRELLRAARVIAQPPPQARRGRKGKEAKMAAAAEESSAGSWTQFMACVRCLADFGMVDEEVQVTEMGRMVASINADNSLWLGTVLLSAERLYDMGPHELAGAISSLVCDMRRPDAYVAVEASEAVQEFVEESIDMQARVFAAQLSHQLDFDIPLDPAYAGLVEAWVLGMPWSELVARTSVQEGDLIRIMRRVLDALRQIPNLPFVAGGLGVGPELRLNARRALTLMDRFPVSDDVTYTVMEEERVEEADQGEVAEARELMRGMMAGGGVGAVDGDEEGSSMELLSNEDLYVQSGDEDGVSDAARLWEGVGAVLAEDYEDEVALLKDLAGSVEEEEEEEEESEGWSGRVDDEEWLLGLGLGKEVESLPGDFRI